ncbi:hypothetical protein [Mitsuaria sp. GD03876]|uniref:hypothetical protein n=1 Tax=Mitsuaria sp. GD03876 TaxID=2975399 RepID=UPI00244D7035|nr:hypothetical protein [Mitsuaria sp. GD03876]MDH0864502.1 hypothetical protein [Mitsuaria sp. GD03876]
MPFPSPVFTRHLLAALSLGAASGLAAAEDELASIDAAVESHKKHLPHRRPEPVPQPSPAASAPAPVPGPWTPWNNLHFRLDETGEVQCYSEDGERCSLNMPDPALARPVRCDQPDDDRRTGYERLDHWCNDAYANLFAKWTNYRPLGYPVILATNPRGDVMCKSLDATTCLAPGEHGPLAPKVLRPVVCGAPLSRRAGMTGYHQPGHWCASPELVRRIKAPAGGPLWVSKDRRVLTQRYQVTLPGWQAHEQPTWIVRFKMPHPDRSGVHLEASGKLLSWQPESGNRLPFYDLRQGGKVRTASVEMTGGKRQVVIDDDGQSGGSRMPVLDRQGRGMLALRIDDPGRVRFFQDSGWHHDTLSRLDLDQEGRLLPLHERVRWPESPAMALNIVTSFWPAEGRRRTLDASDLLPARLPVLHDILVTRQRPRPGTR